VSRFGTTTLHSVLKHTDIFPLAVPVGIWIFAFTTYRHVHWIWPIIGSIPFGAGTVWTFNSVFSYLVDAYKPVSLFGIRILATHALTSGIFQIAASAMSFNSFVRCAVAAGMCPLERRITSSYALGVLQDSPCSPVKCTIAWEPWELPLS
jgi:hypothetical protein